MGKYTLSKDQVRYLEELHEVKICAPTLRYCSEGTNGKCQEIPVRWFIRAKLDRPSADDLIWGVLIDQYNNTNKGLIMTDIKHQPRHNPGNLRAMKNDTWLGQTGVENNFVTFSDDFWGVRALYKTLNTYYFKHDRTTVKQIITRYAPQTENNTKAYIAFVSHVMMVRHNAPLSEWTKASFMLGMCIARFEQGDDVSFDRRVFAQAWGAAFSDRASFALLASWKNRLVMAKLKMSWGH